MGTPWQSVMRAVDTIAIEMLLNHRDLAHQDPSARATRFVCVAHFAFARAASCSTSRMKAVFPSL